MAEQLAELINSGKSGWRIIDISTYFTDGFYLTGFCKAYINENINLAIIQVDRATVTAGTGSKVLMTNVLSRLGLSGRYTMNTSTVAAMSSADTHAPQFSYDNPTDVFRTYRTEDGYSFLSTMLIIPLIPVTT